MRPSFGWALTALATLYAAHSAWSVWRVFTVGECSPGAGARCARPLLGSRPHELIAWAGTRGERPSPKPLLRVERFDHARPFLRTLDVKIPQKVRNNGTMFLYIGVIASRKTVPSIEDVKREGSFEIIPLIYYTKPQEKTFNLLGEKSDESAFVKNRPVGHIKKFISFSVLSETVHLHINELPFELLDRIRLTNDDFYFPIIQHNFLKDRLQDLEEIKNDMNRINISLEYVPTSIGKMKFLVQLSVAMQSLVGMGFSEKDIDDVKGMFADTNLYLLLATVIISSFHLLFDFLAFKNDVLFWKGKCSMEGLSVRTVLWRAFSQAVITLYLFDENTSLLVLIPSAIATVIELWKVKKILHLDIDWRGRKFPLIYAQRNKINEAEIKTRAVDAEAMKYLSYILYPICICGAIYSLFYQPHRSWYSWTLNSLVNGVYAFGFLFMLPQLFINYKLKSVAALPWRAFMYKAFNTFIDDVFAFIITMPVAHRVACFRDDVVFIIYLYQRWLYPVDKSRVDNSFSVEETVCETHTKND